MGKTKVRRYTVADRLGCYAIFDDKNKLVAMTMDRSKTALESVQRLVDQANGPKSGLSSELKELRQAIISNE